MQSIKRQTHTHTQCYHSHNERECKKNSSSLIVATIWCLLITCYVHSPINGKCGRPYCRRRRCRVRFIVVVNALNTNIWVRLFRTVPHTHAHTNNILMCQQPAPIPDHIQLCRFADWFLFLFTFRLRFVSLCGFAHWPHHRFQYSIPFSFVHFLFWFFSVLHLIIESFLFGWIHKRSPYYKSESKNASSSIDSCKSP